MCVTHVNGQRTARAQLDSFTAINMQSKSAVATLHNPEGNYAIIESKWPICKKSCVERAEQDIGIAPCLVDRLKCKIVQTILVNCCAHDSLQFHTVAIIPIDRHFCTTLHHCPVPGRSYLFRVPAHNITTQCVLQRADGGHFSGSVWTSKGQTTTLL